MKIPDKYTRKMPSFDALAHYFYDTCMAENCNFRETGLLCPLCGRPLTYVYHEETLYSVCCKTCEKITVTTAINPKQAAEFAGGYYYEEP